MIFSVAAFLMSAQMAKISISEDTCAYNLVYHEARGESLGGQRAVLEVALNRALKEKTGICHQIRKKGQFSWYGKKKMVMLDSTHLYQLKSFPTVLNVGNSKKPYLYFYSGKKPYWVNSVICDRKIGGHNFCRERK